MTRDIIEINDFTILVEEARANEPTVDSCFFEEPIIGVAFYGSGNVDLKVKYGQKQYGFNRTKGLALSFFADEEVEFVHTVSASKPLECVVIATAVSSLDQLPDQEGELFGEMLKQLVDPADHYVGGPNFIMTPEMQRIVDTLFDMPYSGKTKMMYFRSQVTTLLSHYFGQLAIIKAKGIKTKEREKLNLAKSILLENIENPPSLNELAKQIGLNSFALKKEFKAFFGVPVFKYLQNQRLSIAHKLIRNQEATVQEAAWHVGYDSLSSFSNAFEKKFGYRPSQIK